MTLEAINAGIALVLQVGFAHLRLDEHAVADNEVGDLLLALPANLGGRR